MVRYTTTNLFPGEANQALTKKDMGSYAVTVSTPERAIMEVLYGVPGEELKSGKVKARDATHLACAETGECDYFVTCDDALITAFERHRRGRKLKVKAINPVEFIRSKGETYGQS